MYACEPSTDNYCRFINDFSVVAKNRITDANLSSNDSVYASQFSIKFSLHTNTFKCQSGEQESYSPSSIQYNFDTIMSISITSNEDFNTSSPAGTELGQYFSMPDYKWYKSVLSNEKIEDLNLNLVQGPDWPGIHTFNVKLRISGKSEISHFVTPVLIKK